MKKLSKILGIIIMTLIIITTTSIYAYTGTIDTNDNILISEVITDGQSVIDITRDVVGYKLYYQWVEIDNNTYKQIEKLKVELKIIEYYNIYDATNSDEDYENYFSAQLYYESIYGTHLEDCSEQKANENIGQITKLLPNYTDNWQRTTDNTFKMDLSTFSGTKDFVVWVQLEKKDGTKEYDAEVFELTGTKQEILEDDSKDLDKNDNIFISEILTNGQGIIEITRDINGYKLYYQWIEIDNELYKQIRKLKDELQVIQYFNIYETTGEDKDYENYSSSQVYYESIYGTELKDCSKQKAKDNLVKISELLPEYTNIWKRTTDNTFNMDLSTYYGTKYYTLWTQLEKQDGTKAYDAEIFEIEGTKKDIIEDDKKEDNKPIEDDKKEDNKPIEDDKKEDNKPIEDDKKEDNKPIEDDKKEDNKPIEDDKKEDNKPIEDDKKEDNKPIEDDKKEDNKPIEDDKKEDNKPIEDDKKEDNKPIEDDKKEDNKPIEDDKKEDNKPIEDDKKEDNILIEDSKLNKDNVQQDKIDSKTDENSKSNITTTASQKNVAVQDKTTSQKNLPYTGINKGMTVCGICALLSVAMVTFVKYKKIK